MIERKCKLKELAIEMTEKCDTEGNNGTNGRKKARMKELTIEMIEKCDK